ncbi:uncharacterized protein SAPINGB_P005656 [Magnusiomyces paraingens]|uniref:Hyphally-regulated cell wall protein N-terminal domain-containing protein n=1 Tax=Magnusiomyces paraingens TaxID=2606893 RepID=A0A5E8C2R4_9ASCO|nr:uncharacterized protein SAPINGB_P005656 [Saprochaete ingens]VVT57300.1 unnamed protein product [Saprochaete ingens]
MKFYSFLLSLFLSAIIGVFADNSPDFTLRVYAPDTKLDGFNLFLKDDGKLYMSATADVCTAHIYENGTLILGGQVVGDGRNYLSTAAYSTAWKPASNWTVVDGFLELYNDTYFHAIPEGTVDGLYVLGTGNAISSGDDITEIQIIPVELETNYIIQEWPVEAGINALGSSVLYTQTFFAYMTASSTVASTLATVAASVSASASSTSSASTTISSGAAVNLSVQSNAGLFAGLMGLLFAMF